MLSSVESHVQYRSSFGWDVPARHDRTDLASRAASRLLARLRAAYATMAVLVIHDDVYAPIFARLEAEIEAEEAKLNVGDPVSQARAIVAARTAARRAA